MTRLTTRQDSLSVLERENPELFELHAAFCSIFVSATRLRIMWLLGDSELSVGTLAEALGLSLSNVSQHLRVMRDQGAVKARREGHQVLYRISNPKFLEGARTIRQGLVEELSKRASR